MFISHVHFSFSFHSALYHILLSLVYNSFYSFGKGPLIFPTETLRCKELPLLSLLSLPLQEHLPGAHLQVPFCFCSCFMFVYVYVYIYVYVYVYVYYVYVYYVFLFTVCVCLLYLYVCLMYVRVNIKIKTKYIKKTNLHNHKLCTVEATHRP